MSFAPSKLSYHIPSDNMGELDVLDEPMADAYDAELPEFSDDESFGDADDEDGIDYSVRNNPAQSELDGRLSRIRNFRFSVLGKDHSWTSLMVLVGAAGAYELDGPTLKAKGNNFINATKGFALGGEQAVDNAKMSVLGLVKPHNWFAQVADYAKGQGATKTEKAIRLAAKGFNEAIEQGQGYATPAAKSKPRSKAESKGSKPAPKESKLIEAPEGEGSVAEGEGDEQPKAFDWKKAAMIGIPAAIGAGALLYFLFRKKPASAQGNPDYDHEYDKYGAYSDRMANKLFDRRERDLSEPGQSAKNQSRRELANWRKSKVPHIRDLAEKVDNGELTFESAKLELVILGNQSHRGNSKPPMTAYTEAIVQRMRQAEAEKEANREQEAIRRRQRTNEALAADTWANRIDEDMRQAREAALARREEEKKNAKMWQEYAKKAKK